MEKLKPCPFCGEPGEGEHYARCSNPDCPADELMALPSEWNVRPREQALERLLREAKGTIEQLRAVQNGCPLPSYEEAFNLANSEADRMVLSIGAALEVEHE